MKMKKYHFKKLAVLLLAALLLSEPGMPVLGKSL